jgi:hypothetical protein
VDFVDLFGILIYIYIYINKDTQRIHTMPLTQEQINIRKKYATVLANNYRATQNTYLSGTMFAPPKYFTQTALNLFNYASWIVVPLSDFLARKSAGENVDQEEKAFDKTLELTPKYDNLITKFINEQTHSITTHEEMTDA